MFKEKPISKKSMTKRKPLYGVGINDVGYIVTYWDKESGSIAACPYYKKWRDMLYRCYSKKGVKRRLSVHPDWLVFSVFRAWMKRTEKDYASSLVQDFVDTDSREYSEISCCLVPLETYNLVRNPDAKGVHYHERIGKYEAYCNYQSKREYLGLFEKEHEALRAYKDRKYEIVKEAWYAEKDKKVKRGLHNFLINLKRGG